MGALDWLQEIIGGGGGGRMPMPPMQDLDPRPSVPFPQGGDPMAGMGTPPLPMGTDPMTAGLKPPTPDPLPTQAMPPVQQTGADSRPWAVGGDPMAGGGSGNDPGLPPRPPMPPIEGEAGRAGMNRGPGLPPNMPVPPAMAPNLPPPQNIAPPIPPTDMSAAARMIPPEPTSSPQAKGIIGRALGLDPNREAQLRGSLGAGLKSVGENAHKPGLAAFAGSMGSGIEGGKGADDKTTDQQDRFLGRAISSKNAATTEANGASTRELNVARTKLAIEQAKMAGKGGKDSVVNSEQQLYLRAQSAAAQDGRLKALKTQADQASTQFGIDSAQAKAAIKAHKDAYDQAVEGHAKALGIDPGKVAKIGKQPGMAADNPVPKAGLTKEKFDALPPGAFFVNPKDGKVLVKKGAAAPAAGANPSAPAQQMTPSVPPIPPTPVTAPAGSQADDEE